MTTSHTDVFQLTLPLFEGPLDLLLHLIEREELDITNVSLVAVADQYMGYLRAQEQLNIDALADFIYIGARLMLMKSRALLPRPPAPDDVSTHDDDPDDDLARQLLEYKLFKEAAGQLRAIETAGLHSYPRIAPPPELPAPHGLDGVTMDLLRQMVETAMARKPEAQHVQVIHRHKITVAEKVSLIRALLASEGRVSFLALIERCESRMEIVVSFMAVLELIKSYVLEAVQDAAFADILLVPPDDAPADVAATESP